jgi:hypothetical protein
MTRRITLLIILSLLIMIPLTSFADDNFDQHFTLSVLFGAIGETTVHNRETFNVTKKILVGTVIGSVPGLIKEIGDSTNNNNYFSETQILYDVMGSAVGSIIAYKYHSRTKVNVSGVNGGAKITFVYSY